MIVLPIFLQMVLEYNAMAAGLSLAPLSLSMFAIALVAARRAGRRRPSSIIRAGFAIYSLGILLLLPIVPRADVGLVPRRPADHHRRRARPARVAAEQLHARPDLARSGSARPPG